MFTIIYKKFVHHYRMHLNTNLFFSFLDTPYCYNTNKRTIIEVNNEEFVQLECLIRSSGPASDIQFNWYINSSTSGQHNQVLPSQYKSNGTKSFFRYNVKKGVISETIICQASNAAGSSNQPCTFIVTSGMAGGKLLITNSIFEADE